MAPSIDPSTGPFRVNDQVLYTQDEDPEDIYTVMAVHVSDRGYSYDLRLNTDTQVVYRDVIDGYIKPPAAPQQPIQ